MSNKTFAVLAIAVLCFQSVQAFNATDAIAVVAGVMNGILHKDNYQYLLGCMNGTEALVVDIEDAVRDFEKGGYMGIGEGIMDIGKFIEDLPPTVYYCDGIPDDFKRLGEFFSIFGNFTLLTDTVSHNMIWHYKEIKGDINLAVQDFHDEKYFDCGDEIGEALVVALKHDSKTVVNSYY